MVTVSFRFYAFYALYAAHIVVMWVFSESRANYRAVKSSGLLGEV
jgi:hypothetical protein